MKFEQLKFQRPWQEEVTGWRKLLGFVKESADRLRAEGLPIGADGRISPDGYSGVYSQEVLERDKKIVQDYEKKFDEQKYTIRDVEKSDAGEGFEILTVGILQKFFGDKFYVLRTSKFDDIQNKVDILILEKRTGRIVCGIDDVQDSRGDRYTGKRNTAENKNIKFGGATIKYGFTSYRNYGEEFKFRPAGTEKVPIIVFSMSSRNVENYIENFNTNSDKEVFDKFLKTRMSQEFEEVMTQEYDEELVKHLPK